MRLIVFLLAPIAPLHMYHPIFMKFDDKSGFISWTINLAQICIAGFGIFLLQKKYLLYYLPQIYIFHRSLRLDKVPIIYTQVVKVLYSRYRPTSAFPYLFLRMFSVYHLHSSIQYQIFRREIKSGKIVYEDCYGQHFMHISFIV